MKKKFFKILTSFMAIVIMSTSLPLMAFAAETKSVWKTMAPMSMAIINFQSVTINGKIYIMGGGTTLGSESSSATNKVEEYDPSTNTWTQKAPMHVSRKWFQAELLNGKIYVIGGTNEKGSIASVEEYDPLTDTWTQKSSMSVPRSYVRTVVINGKIYAIGGVNSSDGFRGTPLNSMEVYDPSTDKWEAKAPMKTVRKEFQAQAIGGNIYVMGGLTGSSYMGDGTTSVEEYNTSNNTWTAKKSMLSLRRNFGSCQVNGKIYICGNTSPYIEQYDPQSDQWEKKASFSSNEMEYMKVINGKIYISAAFFPSSNLIGEYDPKTNKVTNLSLPVSLLGAVETYCSGKLYIMGGIGRKSVYACQIDNSPTLTVKASSNKVMVNQKFTTGVAVHNGTNICAEDIKVTYDPDLFEYNGVQAENGMKIYKEDKSTPGTLRFIAACEGKDNAATGDKNLFHLIFTAKKPGTGKVDIIKGRIADNATLEEDVTDENCGEDTITVEEANDVNRSGEYTLLDLGIDAWYDGMKATDTDTTKYHADIVADGVIDDKDLAQITQEILANSNYGPNN